MVRESQNRRPDPDLYQISPDPINGHVSSSQSWNRYAYVTNNPVNLTDSTGMMIDASRDWESVGAQLRMLDPKGAKSNFSEDNSAAEAGFDWGLSDLFADTPPSTDYAGDGIVTAGETVADEGSQDTVKVTHNDPIILDYSVKYLDKTSQGEVPVGGRFQINYKYSISIT